MSHIVKHIWHIGFLSPFSFDKRVSMNKTIITADIINAIYMMADSMITALALFYGSLRIGMIKFELTSINP